MDKCACLIGKYIVKEFLPSVGNEVQLFTAEVISYDQALKKFAVKYHADDVIQIFSPADTQKMHEEFESWYAKVSKGGQRFTREQALPVVVGAYNKEKLMQQARAANPMDLTKSDDESDEDGDANAKMRRQIERGVAISKMKVQQLRDEL